MEAGTKFYGYVADPNALLDPFGLDFFRGSRPGQTASFEPRPNDFKVDPESGLVKPTHGVSVFDNAESVASKGFTPHKIDEATIPESLHIKQRGADPHHFEIMPKEPMSPEKFREDLKKIKTCS